MGDWKQVKMGDFLKLYRIEHIIESDKNYKQVTISNKNGISFRGSKLGKNIGRKRQFIIDLRTHPNTVLFTRQGIREGSIGIAPPEVDQSVVTENMPMMSVNTDMIEVAYLKKLLLSKYLREKVRLLLVVGSAQKSIHERDFLNIELEIPNIKIQREKCKRLYVLDTEHFELKQELTHQQALLKKLRQQILQEAIEGKLTADWREKNPDIEPAGALLKRIQAEKVQLIKDKKIKKQKPLPPIGRKEKPFDLPEGWEWCRLGEIFLMHYGKGLAKSQTKNSDKYAVYGSNGVVGYYSKRLTDKRAIIIGRKGSAGAIQISNQGSWTTDVAYYIEESSLLNFDYLIYLLTSLRLDRLGKGVKPGLNRSEVYSLVIPLVPLKEQKAIVTKVEKLLALCAQLETQITANQAHAEQLMQAVLKETFQQNNSKPATHATGD